MLKTRAVSFAFACLVASLGWGCGDEAPSSPSDSATAADTASAPDASGNPPPRQEAAPEAGSGKEPIWANRSPEKLSSRLPDYNPFAEPLALEDPFERIGTLAELAPTLGPDAVPAARALLNGLNDGTQEIGLPESSLLIQYWSRHEPEAAARWALAQSPLAYRDGLVMPSVAVWAAHDPLKAAEAVLSLVGVTGRIHPQPMQAALVRGWFDSGKPGLVEFIQGRGIGIVRQRMVYVYLKALADRDGPEASIRWAESLPDGDHRFKLAAFRQTAKVVTRMNPTLAAEWCEKVCDGPHGDGVRLMIAQHWGWRDGEGAMLWVSAMPPGQERDRTVRYAFRGWWPHDREGLTRWASELREEGLPDWFQPAIEFFAAGLARWGRPEEAMDWALQIEDEEARRRSVTNVGLIWRKDDEAAADAWLESSPLSEEQRDRIRNPVTGQRLAPAHLLREMREEE